MIQSGDKTTTTHKTDLSITMDKATVQSLFFAVPTAMVFAGIYIHRWGGAQFKTGFDALFANFIVFLAMFILGIVLHELIHGFSWMLFGRKPFSAIKFGFQLKSFTPYAHCLEPMRANPYRIGTAMPGILMGILPAVVGVINGNGWLLAFGLLFITAAGGDFLILWLIRNVDGDTLVEDHPTNAGCYIIEDPVQTTQPIRQA